MSCRLNPYSVLRDVDVDRVLLNVLDENADSNIAVVLVPLMSIVMEGDIRKPQSPLATPCLS